MTVKAAVVETVTMKIGERTISNARLIIMKDTEGYELSLAILEQGAKEPEMLSSPPVNNTTHLQLNHVLIKNYGEYVGLPEALDIAGIASKLEDHITPAGIVCLMKLNFKTEDIA